MGTVPLVGTPARRTGLTTPLVFPAVEVCNVRMAKTVGYMLTCTTYGTWLQGKEPGYVKDGRTRGENVALKTDCEKKLRESPVHLRSKDREMVREAILAAAGRFKQNIPAVAVCSNDVDVVCEYVDVPIGVVAGYYKNAGRKALEESGYQGRVWTKGYDKRSCFEHEGLEERVRYVEAHRAAERRGWRGSAAGR